MSDLPQTSADRREARFPILDAHSCEAKIERRVERGIEVVDGELFDLSRGGAKLRVTTPMQFSEIVRLRIIIPHVDLQIDVTSEVCWARLDGESAWLVGFSFRPKLSEDMLQQLAVHSCIERRQNPRVAVRAEATVSLQSMEESYDVVLQDISAGGFCMTCDHKIPLDEKLLLNIPTSNESCESITARVVWEMRSDGEHLVGCALNSSNDYPRLSEAVGHDDADNDDPVNHEVKWPRFLQVGLAAAILMILGLFGALLMGIYGDNSTIESRYVSPTDSPWLTKLHDQRRDDGRGGGASNHAADEELQTTLKQRSPSNVSELQEVAVDRNEPPMTFDDPRDDQNPFQDDPIDVPLVSSNGRSLGEFQHPTTKVVPPMDLLHDAELEADRLDSIRQRSGRPLHHVQAPSPRDRPTRNRSVIADPPRVAESAQSPAKDHGTPAARPRTPTHIDSFLPATSLSTHPVKPITDLALSSVRAPERVTSVTQEQIGETAGLYREGERSADRARNDFFRETYEPNDVARAAYAVNRGDSAFRTGQYAQAVRAFRDAIRRDADNPRHHYRLAMAQYQMGDYKEAARSADAGITFERYRPIKSWGSTWIRYQGPARIWLEEQRRSRDPK